MVSKASARTVVSLLLMLAVLGGCTSSSGESYPTDDQSSSTITVPMTKGFLLTSGGPPATMEALIVGTLAIDTERACVTIDNDDVVFPQGTVLDLTNPDEPAISMSGQRLVDGQDVELGGGYVSKSEVGGFGNYGHLADAEWCTLQDGAFLLSGR